MPQEWSAHWQSRAVPGPNLLVYNAAMPGLEFPPLRVLIIIVIVTEVMIGWIPLLIAFNRQARYRPWIAILGFLTAPIPVFFMPVLLWSLLAPSSIAQGRGIPIDKNP